MLETCDKQFRRSILRIDFQPLAKPGLGKIPALTPVRGKAFGEMIPEGPGLII